MNAGFGIAGFVNGLVAGAELRQGFQDRKRRQELDDEDRKLRMEDRALRLEDRERAIKRQDAEDAWRMEERAYAREERGILRAERDEERAREKKTRKVYEDAYTAAKESQQAAQDARSQPDPAGDAPAAAQQPGAVPPPDAGAPQRVSRGLPSLEAGRPDDGVPMPPAVDPSVAPQPSRAPTEQPLPAWGRARAGRGIVYTNAPDQAAQPVSPSLSGSAAPLTPPAPGVAPLNTPRGVAGQQPALPAPRLPSGAPGPATAPDGTPRAPVPSAAPEGSSPPVTPSVEIAVDTARKSRGVKPTEAVDDFMDHYRKVAVPQIVEHYLSTGDVEAAKQFEAWSEAEEVKAGKKAWGLGMIAAEMGDEDGFMTHMTDAFNAPGYFEDGYEIVPEKSGILRGEGGQSTGAYITVRDQESGSEQKIDFDSMEDFIRFGMLALSPEAVFEEGRQAIQAADEIAKGELEHQRKIELAEVQAGLRREGEQKTDGEILDAEIAQLRETDLTFSQLSPEEQVRRAVASIQAKRSAAAGGISRPASRGVVAARGE